MVGYDPKQRSSSAAPRSRVGWSNLLGASCILFLQKYQRNSTEYGYGRQYQTQGYGLAEENDTA